MSFPRYAKYKDSGVEWLGEVPAHWEVCPLKRIIRMQSGESITSESIEESGEFPVYGGNGLRGYTSRFTHDGTFVLIGRQGALCGNINYASEKFWASEHAVVVYPNRVLEIGWLGELLRAMNLNQYSISAAQPGISVEFVGRLLVGVPPMPEQTAIAAFLKRETGKIDALVAEQQRLIELLKEKRQAVISHAVTKGLNPDAPMKPSGVEWLGEVPAHWEVKRLKYLVSNPRGIQMGPFGGMLLDLESDDTGYKVYGQENTISGNFNLGSRWITEARFRELANYHVQDGDILLTRKGSLGNARLIKTLVSPGIIDSDTIRIRIDTNLILDEFMSLLLHNAGYIAHEISLTKRGAILAGLNSETIANLTIILPPVHEQAAILENLESQSASIDEQICACTRAIDLLQERRAALISAAVTGQIDVRATANRAAA